MAVGNWPYRVVFTGISHNVLSLVDTFSFDIYDADGNQKGSDTVTVLQTENLYLLEERVKRSLYARLDADAGTRTASGNWIENEYSSAGVGAWEFYPQG
jgi:hypothetical protein